MSGRVRTFAEGCGTAIGGFVFVVMVTAVGAFAVIGYASRPWWEVIAVFYAAVVTWAVIWVVRLVRTLRQAWHHLGSEYDDGGYRIHKDEQGGLYYRGSRLRRYPFHFGPVRKVCVSVTIKGNVILVRRDGRPYPKWLLPRYLKKADLAPEDLPDASLLVFDYDEGSWVHYRDHPRHPPQLGGRHRTLAG